MASSLVTFEGVSFACFHIRSIFSLPSSPFVVSTFSYPKTANYIKLKHLPRASSSSEVEINLHIGLRVRDEKEERDREPLQSDLV
ncbi:hypothetical protein RHMOL_Rhmol09G0207900 [Rhododendron molle]|uniref:Uncharacterized protein n=1 Tax=Rhododendron molle TaxID=49168 RepID=A0ACC0MFT4_RHOML|nr:hypothetical protein RHMOL_Rhmol09G0207900 [Rhododendron molle]